MAKQKGQYYSLSYETVALGNITSISMSIDGNQINISDFDSGEFEEFVLGRKNVTLSVSGNWDQADTTGQGTVVDDLLAGNEGTWNFGPASPSAGDVNFEGEGSPSNFSIDASDESPITYSVDIQINGTWTKTVTT